MSTGSWTTSTDLPCIRLKTEHKNNDDRHTTCQAFIFSLSRNRYSVKVFHLHFSLPGIAGSRHATGICHSAQDGAQGPIVSGARVQHGS